MMDLEVDDWGRWRSCLYTPSSLSMCSPTVSRMFGGAVEWVAYVQPASVVRVHVSRVEVGYNVVAAEAGSRPAISRVRRTLSRIPLSARAVQV